jgi:putative membrane protein
MSTASPASAASNDRLFWALNLVVSVGALCLLGWLLLLHGGMKDAGVNLRFLPPLNACLNALSATLLVAGRLAIKRGERGTHRALMLGAFASSALFLVGYLAYHAVHGDTHFGGEGAVKAFYLALLASHVLLSVPVVPLALAAFYFAFQKRFDRHTRLTRLLHPVWLYVSVTGVVVYLMLRPYYPV